MRVSTAKVHIPLSRDSISSFPKHRTLPFKPSRGFPRHRTLGFKPSLAYQSTRRSSFNPICGTWETRRIEWQFISLIKRGIHYEEDYGDRSC